MHKFESTDLQGLWSGRPASRPWPPWTGGSWCPLSRRQPRSGMSGSQKGEWCCLHGESGGQSRFLLHLTHHSDHQKAASWHCIKEKSCYQKWSKLLSAPHSFPLSWEHTCFWCSLAAGHGLWGWRSGWPRCSGSRFGRTSAVFRGSSPRTSSVALTSWTLSFARCSSWPSLERRRDKNKKKKTCQDMSCRGAKLKKQLNDSSSVLLKFWETELLN